jgi:hypothetical protein
METSTGLLNWTVIQFREVETCTKRGQYQPGIQLSFVTGSCHAFVKLASKARMKAVCRVTMFNTGVLQDCEHGRLIR